MWGVTVVGGSAIVEGMDEDSCLLVKAWNEEFFPFYTPEDITTRASLNPIKAWLSSEMGCKCAHL
jgi:hypothetical protein